MFLRNITIVTLLVLIAQQVIFNLVPGPHTEETRTTISRIDVLHETADEQFLLEQVRPRFAEVGTEQVSGTNLSFGIGSEPVWVRLRLENLEGEPVMRRLTSGVTWIDDLEVYHVSGNRVVQQWRDGDGMERTSHLIPGVGFVFDLRLPPGRSEVYIRAATDDPLVLPIRFQSLEKAGDSAALINTGYGMLYGLLVALISYNLMLYTIFRQPRFFFYSLYVACFAVVNVGYTGQGFSWLYPTHPGFQNFSTLAMMVGLGVCGLLFASSFLELKENMPRIYRSIIFYIIFGLVLIAAFTVMQNHYAAAIFSFAYLAMTTIVMIVLGFLSLRTVEDADYFVFAVSASMFGLLITTITVWGFIPFTVFGYHAAEVGVLIEAAVLAGVLARQLMYKEGERISAKRLASYDPLTELRNRRSFLEIGHEVWNKAVRDKLPLSLIVIDVDHFKMVNDRYGHNVGDEALIHVARLMSHTVRDQDILARWGGEEIVLLMPETDASAAVATAERLRNLLESTPLSSDEGSIRITASFGVAERKSAESFDELFNKADRLLYAAKNNGRNRVESGLATADIAE